MNEKALLSKIKELEDELNRVKKLPYYEAHMADLIQLEYWNKEIQNDPVSINAQEEGDLRAFNKCMEYMKSKYNLMAALEENIKKMFPDEVEKMRQTATSAVDDIRKKVKDELRTGAANKN